MKHENLKKMLAISIAFAIMLALFQFMFLSLSRSARTNEVVHLVHFTFTLLHTTGVALTFMLTRRSRAFIHLTKSLKTPMHNSFVWEGIPGNFRFSWQCQRSVNHGFANLHSACE